MKILRLFCILFFVMSTFAHAAETQRLSQQERESVQTLSQEMSALGVSKAMALKMLTQMHENQFQNQNIVRAKNIVAEAAQNNLPTKPVMDKAMEGMAKKVPEGLVIKAMETVRNRHIQAHRLAKILDADGKNTAAITITIADSLAAGMNIEDLNIVAHQLKVRTREQNKNRTEELSLRTMQMARTMTRLGGGSSDVSGAVCKALDNQYTSQQMEQLRHRFITQSQFTSGRQLAHQYATGSLGKGSKDKGFGGRNSNSSDDSGGRGSSGDNGSGGSGGGSSGGNGGSDSSGGNGGSDSSGGNGGSGSSGGNGGSGDSGGNGGSGGGR